MWVADERVKEYLEAGHVLASVPSAKPAEVTVEEKPVKVEKEEPVKASPRRTTRAKRK